MDEWQQRLSEKNIIVAGAGVALPAQLAAQGARVWVCPAGRVVAADDYELLDQALENLYGYDWLLFTTPAGVEFFLQRFAANQREIYELDDLRVCAVGASTVARLADEHLHVDIAPACNEMVWQNLVDYVGHADQLRHLNFLAPQGSATHSAMVRQLEAAGARVDVVPAYSIMTDSPHERAKIAALLKGGGVDAIVFADAPGVANFAQLFDTADMRELLQDVTVLASHDAARAARTHGLLPSSIPDDFSALTLDF